MSKKAAIISAFPACGKSYLAKYSNPYTYGKIILDNDSSNFSWLEPGVRNPAFPENYVQYIKDNMDKADIIFISSHKVLREALYANHISFSAVIPDEQRCRNEWVARCFLRGNTPEFIHTMYDNWDKWLGEIIEESKKYPEMKGLYRLGRDDYMSNIIQYIV